MHPKLPLLLLLLITAAVASATVDFDWGVEPIGVVSRKKCDGWAGECHVERRELRAKKSKRFISYDALKRNLVPCSRRGASYYNCRQQGKANPYDRGCTVITRCARDTG